MLFPNRAEQFRDYSLRSMRGRKVDPIGQSEVDFPISKGLAPVKSQLRLTDFPAITPVMTEVESPVGGVQ